ncbi:unnamed protein product, partial [Prorocentrum cordatum]
VERGGPAVSVTPCSLLRSRLLPDYAELWSALDVTATTSLGSLALSPVAGLYHPQPDEEEVVLLHNASSQVHLMGPADTIQRALGTKLFLLSVPQGETQTTGQLLIRVTDLGTGLSVEAAVRLRVGTAVLPFLSLVGGPGRVNASARVGGAFGWDVSVPNVTIASEAADGPCLVALHVPSGELRAPPLPGRVLSVSWSPRGNGSYELLAHRTSEANEVLGSMQYTAWEAALLQRPTRVPLTILLYAVSSAERPLERVLLRDRRVVYLELHPEPSVPKVHAGARRLGALRTRRSSLGQLAIGFEHPRPLAAQVACNACVISDEVFDLGRVHKFFGSAAAVAEHLGGLSLTVSCTACASDTLTVRAWDPALLESVTSEPPPRLYSEVSIRIEVGTSELARGPPRLSVLSQGFKVLAGESLGLEGVVQLRCADEHEPLGLRAVEAQVEARLHCSQGTLAVDTAQVVAKALAPSSLNAVVLAHAVEANASNASNAAPRASLPRTAPRRGRSIAFRGAAADVDAVLGTLVYTPARDAAGEDSVVVDVGAERDAVPVYVERPRGELRLAAAPLVHATAGKLLRPSASLLAGPLVAPGDGVVVRATCGHCLLSAWWRRAGEPHWERGAISFTASVAEAGATLRRLAYMAEAGFHGMDQLSIAAEMIRPQALWTAVPRSQVGIAVLVRPDAERTPPAGLEMPGRLVVAGGAELVDPQIAVRAQEFGAPSGLALAPESSSTCLRACRPEALLPATAPPGDPCELFAPVPPGRSGGSECGNCSTMRPASFPDQCLTWEIGAGKPPAESSAASTENASANSSNATDAPTPAPTAIADSDAVHCVQVAGMTVLGEVWQGVPTTFYAGEARDCSGQAELQGRGGNASARCDGSMRCEYLFQPSSVADPAPGCSKQLRVNFTCPSGVELQVVSPIIPAWQAYAVTMVPQCPVVLPPAVLPVAMRGALATGSFTVPGIKTLAHLRYLSDCARELPEALGAPPPQLVAAQPRRGDTAVGIMQEVQLTFDENVRVGHGSCYIRKVKSLHTDADSPRDPEVIALAINISGPVLTGTLDGALAPLTVYELVVEPDAVEDIAGNPFAGLSGMAHSFTTGLGSLLPIGWRVVAGEPMANGTEAAPTGWRVGELAFHAQPSCDGDPLRGAPVSSRAERSPAPNATGGAAGGAAAAAFDGDGASFWESAADVGGTPLEPAVSRASAWLGLVLPTAATNTSLGQAGRIADVHWAPSAKAAARSVRLVGPEGLGPGSPPRSFSVQFYLGGGWDRWHVLLTVPYMEGCFDLPTDLEEKVLQQPDTRLPTLTRATGPTGDKPAVLALEFDESVKVQFGQILVTSARDNSTTTFMVDPMTGLACEAESNASSVESNTTGVGCIPWASPPPSCVRISANQNVVFMDVTSALVANLSYRMVISESVVRDLSDNMFQGVTISFNLVPPSADHQEPALLVANPPHRAENVSAASALEFEFSEALVAGAGAVVVTPDVGPARTLHANSSGVCLAGHRMAVTLPGGLPPGWVEVTIAAGALHDQSGNPFRGIVPGALRFHVRAPSSAPVVSRPAAAASSLQLLGGASGVRTFCLSGPPFALAELARALRYQPQAHWEGQEPLRVVVTAARNFSHVFASAQTWIYVQHAEDPPALTASRGTFAVRAGSTVALGGVEVWDADGGVGTRWMTLMVSASAGILFLEDAYVLSPAGGTLRLVAGRLDGDSSLRVQGSREALRGFVGALRFGLTASKKPSLSSSSPTEPQAVAAISYTLSDGTGAGAAALLHSFVAGRVLDAVTGGPVEGVEVVIVTLGSWLGFAAKNASSGGCDPLLVRQSIDACKAETLLQGHVGFAYDSRTFECCMKKGVDAPTLLENMVDESTVTLYVYQLPGFTVHTGTDSFGVYTATLPSGVAAVSLYRYNYERMTRYVSVEGTIQVGGAADAVLIPAAVVTVWSVTVSWSSLAGEPVDVDAHAFDAWGCHTHFARQECEHDVDHGLRVTYSGDINGGMSGQEVMTFFARPCDVNSESPGELPNPPGRYIVDTYAWYQITDVQTCLAYFWAHIFSEHDFSDVRANLTIHRNDELYSHLELDSGLGNGSGNGSGAYWLGLTFDWTANEVYVDNRAGNASDVEAFLGGQALPPGRSLGSPAAAQPPPKDGGQRARRLVERALGGTPRQKRAAAAGGPGPGGGARRLSAAPQDAAALHALVNQRPLNVSGSTLFLAPGPGEVDYAACWERLRAPQLPDPHRAWRREVPFVSDDAVEVPLGRSFRLYGQDYWSVSVSPYGFLAFGAGIADFAPGVDAHMGRLGISGLACDLALPRGGRVWHEVFDTDGQPRAVFTFEGVPTVTSPATSTFQIALYFSSGAIRLSWLEVAPEAAAKAVVGLSPGLFGVSLDPLEGVNATCGAVCGDGSRQFSESCDDGNSVDGDGCSAECDVEQGFFVVAGDGAGGADISFPIKCGDGRRDGAEECDDHNTLAGDGCSENCTAEAGYTCGRPDDQHSDVCRGTGPAASQLFEQGAFDLEGFQLVFTPSVLDQKYTVCRSPLGDSAMLPDSHSPGAIAMVLRDDEAVMVSPPKPFVFYGEAFSNVYIGSNGYITFERGDVSHRGGLEKHFEVPRISGLFADLNPEAGGSVRHEIIDDGTETRMVITFDAVPDYASNSPNSFQIALYLEDGRIRLSWTEVSPASAVVVGLSRGDQPRTDSLYLPSGFLYLEDADLKSVGIDSFYSGDFTWELFYKLHSAGPRATIMGNALSDAQPSLVSLDINEQDQVAVQVRHNGGANESGLAIDGTSPRPLVHGVWVHLALTVDRAAACSPLGPLAGESNCTRVALYVDGGMQGLWEMLEASDADSNAGQGLLVGGGGGAVPSNSTWGSTRECSVAGVRVYGRLLSEAELGACTDMPRRTRAAWC